MTLVELLIASTMGLVVVGAALSMFVSGVRSEPRTASKVAAIQQARFTLDRMTRELRQGLSVEVPTSTELEMVTYVKEVSCGGVVSSTSIPCEVTYDCEGEICTRTVAQPDGSAPGSPTQVVEGLASPEVFDPEPALAPIYIGVDFAIATETEDPVELSDGVALRNLGDEE